ncbi:PIR Superfamily Protein [Plasmodium ovale wallikeri]|uniref:PIR Superfamily Protein n=1 Tax=Plasmodium ovale wallikeri TaxID=864142 RepID=A0A1A9ALM2_PLAOA|nr:PIR Superfamily Protein [Plasmodium ovale wallikeri]
MASFLYDGSKLSLICLHFNTFSYSNRNLIYDIRESDLPSKRYKDVWNEGICYDEVNGIINEEKEPSEADKWMKNYQTKFTITLDEHIDGFKKNNPKKRYRDLYYILNVIFYRIKLIDKYSSFHDFIEETIRGYTKNILRVYDKDNFHENPINVSNYNQVEIENSKKIDNLCEDIDYIDKNIEQINSSSQCQNIQSFIQQENQELKAIYEDSSDKYSYILQFYNYPSFNHFENIIQKIYCKSHVSDARSPEVHDSDVTYQNLRKHITALSILSPLGILLIGFFLIKTTPIGNWINTRIRKKIIFWNKLNDDENHKIVENNCEYSQINSNNDKYDMLYHSIDNY